MSEIHNNHNQSREEEFNFSIADIWNMFWGYKWWYVASIVICLAVAMLNIYKTPNMYVSTAKLIIDESEQNTTMRSLVKTSGYVPGLRGDAMVANEMQAFSSPDLMQKVVESLRLETRYFEKQPLRFVERYQNSPVELRPIEGNPTQGYSFLVTKNQDGQLSLCDFAFGGNMIEDVVECAPGDTVMTPVGLIQLLPTANFDKFAQPLKVTWTNSLGRAKSLCANLSVSLYGKVQT